MGETEREKEREGGKREGRRGMHWGAQGSGEMERKLGVYRSRYIVYKYKIIKE